MFFARTVTDQNGFYLPRHEWQPLIGHLTSVAASASSFGKKFHAGDWLWLAGLWHDLGKYHPDFQRMLSDVAAGRNKSRVDHSTAGAIHAMRHMAVALSGARAPAGTEVLHVLLTAPIAGHHAGLPDGTTELNHRFEEKAHLYEEVCREALPPTILSPTVHLTLPKILSGGGAGEWQLRLEFLSRMILSALVDADRLDAERVSGEAGAAERDSSIRRYASISQLRAVLDHFVDTKVANLAPDLMGPTERSVFRYRQAVLLACREAATWAPGAFSLDVATGGGKTLSSLSFALRHAERHGKDRAIVVIPYTSIIEQTAREYRAALGALGGNVIEHHSAIIDETKSDRRDQGYDTVAERRRRASENWDAPLIVTTAVQFFESLYSSTPSRCRKIHNIANSVVVIDEAQTLPPELLNPSVWVLNHLVEAYGTSIVLSTATQPALEDPFPTIRDLRPIVPREVEPPPRRVRVEFLGQEPTAWVPLATLLAAHNQVLCITHLRRDARTLTGELDNLLGDNDTVHLSATMCPAHRASCLEDIRRRLAASASCRVVSTQLVEAGVDLDFPVVYRCLGGVDSMVQAAGRANREGKLGELGGVLRVFRPPSQPPRGLPRLAAESAETLWRSAALDGETLDLFAYSTGRTFFRHYYGKISDKDHGVTALRREFKFRTVAQEYRFIREEQFSLVVPWPDGHSTRSMIGELLKWGPSRTRLRRIQPYVVSVFPTELQRLRDVGAVESILSTSESIEPTLFTLRREELYSPRYGLDVLKMGPPTPEEFIV